MPLLSPSPPNLPLQYELYPLRTLFAAPTNPDLYRPLLDHLLTTLGHLLPALALSTLFISSTLFTEAISSSKYPAYKAYQKRVAMFGPSMTLFKALKIKLLDGKKEEQEVERLVWGSAHIKKE